MNAVPVATNFTVTVQGSVVWIEPNGGNVRCKGKRRVTWENKTGRKLRVEFKEALEAGNPSPADPVWPFSGNSDQAGVVADPNSGVVDIDDGAKFEGKLVGTGQIIVKYSAAALTSGGAVDTTIKALDPMIIVEQ